MVEFESWFSNSNEFDKQIKNADVSIAHQKR